MGTYQENEDQHKLTLILIRPAYLEDVTFKN